MKYASILRSAGLALICVATVAACAPDETTVDSEKTKESEPVTSPVVATKPEAHVPATAVVPPPPEARVAPTEILWSKGTVAQALDEARAQKKLVFVDFSTEWCSWCRRLEHDTFTDTSVIQAMNERFVCVSVDAESQTGRPLAQRYGVNGYPYLFILAPDGSVSGSIRGYKKPDVFLQLISKFPVAR